MPLFRKRTKTETGGPGASVLLEREGETRIKRIIASVDHLPLSINLIKMAWAAGPVTYVAAVGGYYLGFGRMLPKENLVFFLGYTVIAGIIGVVTNILYSMFRSRANERRQSDLKTVMNRLPDLILAVRNLSLENLSPEIGKLEAAALVLKKREFTPQSIGTVIEDLTDDPVLAKAATRVALYRQAGLHNHVTDLTAEHSARIDAAVSALHQTVPEGARSLRRFFAGSAPVFREGVPREKDFIERILAAIGEENDALMTLQDVEEIIILAFELMCGRDIPAISFSYKGRWKLARAADALEKSRSDFRIAQALGHSRLKALATFLSENDVIDISAASGLRTSVLLNSSLDGINTLTKSVIRKSKEFSKQRTDIAALRKDIAVLQMSLKLYRTVRKAYEYLGRQHANLIKAGKNWEKLAARYPDSVTAFRTGRGKRGLRVFEKTIRLDEKQILEVAKAIAPHLREVRIRRSGARASHQNINEDTLFTADSAKQLAIEITLALEPHIHISRAGIQRTVNSTNAAYLGNIVPSMSASAKIALGTAAVKEIRNDTAKPAEHLAEALVRFYQLDLDEQAIDFLHETYGADPDRLRSIADSTIPSAITSYCILRQRPLLIPAPRSAWYRTLKLARIILEKNGKRLLTHRS